MSAAAWYEELKSGPGWSRLLAQRGTQLAVIALLAALAIDCALIDLTAKSGGKRVWDLLGRAEPQPCVTAYTISLGPPDRMAA